jgi:hypothetical protein
VLVNRGLYPVTDGAPGRTPHRPSTRDRSRVTVDGLRSAPGAARTASARTHTRRELLVSATVEVVRRRRRLGGSAR